MKDETVDYLAIAPADVDIGQRHWWLRAQCGKLFRDGLTKPEVHKELDRLNSYLTDPKTAPEILSTVEDMGKSFRRATGEGKDWRPLPWLKYRPNRILEEQELIMLSYHQLGMRLKLEAYAWKHPKAYIPGDHKKIAALLKLTFDERFEEDLNAILFEYERVQEAGPSVGEYTEYYRHVPTITHRLQYAADNAHKPDNGRKGGLVTQEKKRRKARRDAGGITVEKRP